MRLNYITVGQVKIPMLDYIGEILDNFDQAYPTGSGTNSGAAPAVLFKFYKDCDKTNAKQSDEFYHLVGKTLFSTKRARLDTCVAISFLTTRLRKSEK